MISKPEKEGNTPPSVATEAGSVLSPSVPFSSLSCRRCGDPMEYLGPWGGSHGAALPILYVIACRSCGWSWWILPDRIPVPNAG